MRRLSILVLFLFSHTAVGEEPAADKAPALTKATYSITGLHCPPCPRTVESSVQKLKGVKKIKVDWAAKSAKVEFGETVVPTQQIASAVAATPHMMGAGMHYGRWLALSVSGVKDEGSAKKAEAAVGEILGVAKASASAAQHTISVQFKKDGGATSQQLIKALEQAGFKATNY